MSAQLSPRHVTLTVRNYVDGFNRGEYTMPIWQRQDCWGKTNYRKSLIESIMMGIDLPKIYIGDVADLGHVIIDGGHRTRAITAYLKNEYPITIDGSMVYYTTTPTTTRDIRVMTTEEKEYMDNYKLTLCLYDSIEESMARKIFNKLQNAVPMSVPDVVNSFESELVDTLRETLLYEVIEGITVQESFSLLKALPKPDNNEDLYQLLSLVTICWPCTGDKQMEALKWIEKGTSRNSRCYQYLISFDDTFGGVTNEMEVEFRSFLKAIATILNGNNEKLPTSDFNTFCHAIKWVPNFDISLFWEFFETVQEFNSKKSQSTKEFKKGNRGVASELQVSAAAMDDNYGGKLSEWVTSRTKGGSGEDGMKKRLVIIKQYCMGGEGNVVQGNVEGEVPSGGMTVLQSMTEVIPTATTV